MLAWLPCTTHAAVEWHAHGAESMQHPVYDHVGARYESCTSGSRNLWPRVHAAAAFQSEQMLKQPLQGANGRERTAAWTDFRLEARCDDESECVGVSALAPARLLEVLANRTLVLVGDSVMGQLMGFLSCWLLAGATEASDAGVAARSAAWLRGWRQALAARAAALGNTPQARAVLARATARSAFPLHTAGSAVALPGGATIAMINIYYHLPPGMRWREYVDDFVLPILLNSDRDSDPRSASKAPLPLGERGALVVLNWGLHAPNVDSENASAVAQATAQQ